MSNQELTYEDYNKRSIAVRGDKAKYYHLLSTVGARWNPRMRNGAGWLVPKDNQKELDLLIEGINTRKSTTSTIAPSVSTSPKKVAVIANDAKSRKNQTKYRRENSDTDSDNDVKTGHKRSSSSSSSSDEDDEEKEEKEEKEDKKCNSLIELPQKESIKNTVEIKDSIVNNQEKESSRKKNEQPTVLQSVQEKSAERDRFEQEKREFESKKERHEKDRERHEKDTKDRDRERHEKDEDNDQLKVKNYYKDFSKKYSTFKELYPSDHTEYSSSSDNGSSSDDFPSPANPKKKTYSREDEDYGTLFNRINELQRRVHTVELKQRKVQK